MLEYPNTFPFPNEIINGWNARLKGSELKLLLVVVRQTLGWVIDQETGMRKEEDWITYNQLREKTGLSTQPLSSAIDSLVGYELIQVRSLDGRLLDTPYKRQLEGRRRGSFIYRLNLTVLKTSSHYFENKSSTVLKTKNNKINSIQNKTLQNIYTAYKEKINNRSRLTGAAKRKIVTRLETYSEKELLKAIDNFSKDYWWVEKNAHRGIAWFFHTDDRIEGFIHMKPRSGKDTHKDWNQPKEGKYEKYKK